MVANATPVQSTADIVRSRVQRSQTLTERHRREIRRLVPSERRNTPTRRIAEDFNNRVLVPGRRLSERSMRRGMNDLGERFSHRLIEMWRQGMVEVNGDDGIDLEDFTRRVSYFSRGRILEAALRRIAEGRLEEHVVDGIGISQYSRYIDTVVRLGTYEMAQSPSAAPILSLLGRVEVNCDQQTLASMPVLVDIRKEIRPMAEGEETPFLGLGDPARVKLPLRDKLKFAYAITRETICHGIDQKLREVMMQGAMLLDEYWAPEVVQLLFDVFSSASDNRWPFELNDTKWRTYYQVQSTEGSTPYENLIYNSDDLQRTNYGLFIAIETLFEDMRHFVTGKPIDPGTMNVVGTTRQQAQYIREALGGVTISRTVGGPGNEVMEFDRGARDGWNSAAFTSAWIKKYLHELYSVVESGWSKSEREQAIARSLVAGNTQQAAIVQSEWAREEIPMPTEQANFDREIIWGRKFMEKTGLAVTNPQLLVNVKGLPDGESVPAADPNPIS